MDDLIDEINAYAKDPPCGIREMIKYDLLAIRFKYHQYQTTSADFLAILTDLPERQDGHIQNEHKDNSQI